MNSECGFRIARFCLGFGVVYLLAYIHIEAFNIISGNYKDDIAFCALISQFTRLQA